MRAIISVLLGSLMLAGCGGGGSGTGGSGVQTGVFLDAPVVNLAYERASQPGVIHFTNALGEFAFIEGEEIVFSVGEVVFPPVTAAETVTPLSLFETLEVQDRRVLNVIRLLMALDDGSQGSDSLVIPPAAHGYGGLPGPVVFDSPDFDEDIEALVKHVDPENTLPTDEEAATHFMSHIVALCQQQTFQIQGTDFVVADATNTDGGWFTPVEYSRSPLAGTLTVDFTPGSESCQLNERNEGYNGACVVEDGEITVSFDGGAATGTLSGSSLVMATPGRDMAPGSEFVSAHFVGTPTYAYCPSPALEPGSYSLSGEEHVVYHVETDDETYDEYRNYEVTGTLTIGEDGSCQVYSSEGDWQCDITRQQVTSEYGVHTGAINADSVTILFSAPDRPESFFGYLHGTRAPTEPL